MKRELKFRAWDSHEGKWLFGYELPNLGGFSLIGEVVLFGELSKYPLDYYKHIIITQSIGIKDKFGKDIYEGDWIRTKLYSSDVQIIAEIKWDEDYAQFFADGGDGYEYTLDKLDLEKIEKFANIFEH